VISQKRLQRFKMVNNIEMLLFRRMTIFSHSRKPRLHHLAMWNPSHCGIYSFCEYLNLLGSIMELLSSFDLLLLLCLAGNHSQFR
jgi:hypothetical protein